ncbi:hypothetical protein [uncultured Thiohalocapsa sp.]|mgnify:CR=1 FL=1|uniref:hypothetical protein n=1 Tax=uncultured Thiohalocapsa sp. TaxID=768990 RepID=UPI0025F5D11C|nr:hypothetical protein [uncultured Thiohalocapsa sp.]
MRAGYLYIAPCGSTPRVICLEEADIMAEAPEGVAIVAYFWDLDAAMMHFHADLRRHLLDANRRAYRADMVEAAAALDAIELQHQRTYLAPALAASPAWRAATARLHHKHRRWQRLFDWLGIVGLLLLVLTSLLPL